MENTSLNVWKWFINIKIQFGEVLMSIENRVKIGASHNSSTQFCAVKVKQIYRMEYSSKFFEIRIF